MSYGFIVALSADSLNSTVNGLDTLDKDSEMQGYDLSANVKLWIKNRENKQFIQYSVENSWVIITIGQCFNNESLINVLIDTLLATGNDKSEQIKCKLIKYPGQYCFACFNKESGELILGTDVSGVRSLFCMKSDRTRIISSNISLIKSLLPEGKINPDIENQLFLLRYAYSLPGKTVYQEIEELPSKNIYHENVNETDTRRSFQLDNTYENIFQSGDQQRDLYDCLMLACEQQLGKAKKVGVLLGGFDSALIASLLTKLGVHVETYSFSYTNSRFNQPNIDLLTKSLNIKHHWIDIEPKIIKQGLLDYADYCNGPVSWLGYVIQTQHLCKEMTLDGMEACFCGDGCDSLFLGYPNTHRRGQIYKKLPNLNSCLVNLLKKFFDLIRAEYYLGHLGRVLQSILDGALYKVAERPFYSFQIFGPHSLKSLCGINYEKNKTHDVYFQGVIESFNNFTFERKMYLAKSWVSPNREKLVSSANIAGFSLLSPYMHPAVESFARLLPDEALRPKSEEHSDEGKFLLMKMAENFDLLPKEVIYQPKIAAIKSPIDRWLANELFDFSLSYLANLPFEYNEKYIRSLLGEQAIEKLYKKYRSTDDVVSLAPSLLLTYASFFK